MMANYISKTDVTPCMIGPRGAADWDPSVNASGDGGGGGNCSIGWGDEAKKQSYDARRREEARAISYG
jgi:hypothetical protein